MEKRGALRWLVLMILALTLASSALSETFYATLKYRDTGEAVQQLQEALNLLGYSTGGTDGKFGPATEKAVKQFQKDHHLSVDGLAGNMTQTMIYELAAAQNGIPATSAPTAAPDTSTPAPGNTGGSSGSTTGLFAGDYTTLKYGARGDRVSILQNALNNLGYAAGTVDGRFGLGTQKAVTSFQKNQGLTADGLAGRTTLTRLETVLAGGDVPVTSAPTTAPTAAPATATPAPDTGITLAPILTDAPTATPAPDSGYVIPTRTLRKGYTGEDVRSVQRRLSELKYAISSLDGKYGTGTMEAVKAFQGRNGLTVDGLAGARTCAVLFGSSAIPATDSATTPPDPTVSPETSAPTTTTTPTTAPTTAPDASYTNLSAGSTGEAVTRLQQALKDLKYTVNVTGTYDDVTKAAVIAFQQRNKLTADGIAGAKTQQKLYSGDCVTGDTDLPTLAPGAGEITGPAKSEIRLLHWFDDIKPTIKTGQTILVYDPSTKLAWTLRLYSLGRHADSEPLTLEDTQIMYRAFGNQNTWNQKAVYVRLPSGTWTVASTHDMPHLSGSITSNGFDGHLCVHFLRDMAEAQKNDPSYGVANQKTIRAAWKALTGEDYVEVER